jgi:hypothetical protein
MSRSGVRFPVPTLAPLDLRVCGFIHRQPPRLACAGRSIVVRDSPTADNLLVFVTIYQYGLAILGGVVSPMPAW